ncbi:hypothetical protein BDN72DRAFT_895445 [Pluteus cervinus]|uniref:Uncharacterized protein n=1 Tax=Pluteus cervinus TaxID=181527 RepID=A0ACD3B1J4_9AGAR|nr:hypothetical protein BDN72DRAFT_895445 [Pluteus cervinus]
MSSSQITTFNTLPCEIHGKIFRMKQASEHHPIKTFVILSHVCTMWRWEILNDAELWISMPWYRFRQYSMDLLIFVFTMTPLRSGHPIHIDFGKGTNTGRLAYVLQDFGDRIVSLAYGPGAGDPSKKAFQWFPKTSKTLQSLKFGQTPLPSCIYDGDFKVLHSLELDQCDLNWHRLHSMTSLRHITMCRPAIGVGCYEFLNILLLLPHLTTFHGDHIFHSGPISKATHIPNPFEPPSLSKLSFLEHKSNTVYLLEYRDETSDWIDGPEIEELERNFGELFERILGSMTATKDYHGGFVPVPKYHTYGHTNASFSIEQPWNDFF